MTNFNLQFDPYFDRISLLRATEQFKEPERLFLDLFYREVEESPDKYIRVDFYDEARRIAPFVHRKVKGQLIETKGQKAFIYEPPYIRHKMTITAEDMRKVLPGGQPYAGGSLADNVNGLIARKMYEGDRIISRREELMGIQGIVDCNIPIVDENGNEIGEDIVFTRNSNLVTTANWSNVSTADPMEDIREMARRIGDLTGVQADTVIIGSDIVPKFRNNANVKEQLDNRRMEDGLFSNRILSLGARYIGELEGFRIMSYNWKYLKPDPTHEVPGTLIWTDAFPTNKVVIGCSQARGIRMYGGIEDVDVTTPAMRYPKAWKDDELGIRFLQIESAPLTANTQPDCFGVYTVTV